MKKIHLIDPSLAGDVLKIALSNGADFAELFVEKTKNSVLKFSDGGPRDCISGNITGAGIRIFHKSQSFYGFTSDLSKEALFKTAQAVANAWKTDRSSMPFTLDKCIRRSGFEFKENPFTVHASEKIALLKEADKAARAYDKRVVQVDAAMSQVLQDVDIFNSEGLTAMDRRIHSRFTVMVVAADGNEKQTGSESPGLHKGYEFIRSLDHADHARRAAKQAITMLDAENAPGGMLPVVLNSGFGGVIFHEACGHALESKSIASKTSVFTDCLGKKIAADCVSAADDGTIANEWGSSIIDDEGTPTQRTLLIENGVLKSYMVDKLGQIKTGLTPTGSGRRQSYRFAPTSRMRNTFILPGPHSFNDLVTGVDKGIFAAKMGGGSVNPATGEFNFSVREAYLIEKGKVTKPIRGATLIGNGRDVLKKISMVGSDLKLAAGMCGSISGFIPAAVGQPPILVSEILVGGR